MSSDDSPGANDNGNTDLPTVSITNSDSNHDFFLGSGGGTILGEVSLPSKFLSAKNSIEVHRNKILPNNQSLPNVLKDRGHCLHSLTSANHGSSGYPHVLRTIFSPVKFDHGNSEESTAKHSFSSKSSKTVNWAPILSGQNSSKPLNGMENIDSLRSSNTNVQIHTTEHDPPATLNSANFNTHYQNQEEGNFNENSTFANAGDDITGHEKCKINRTQDVSSLSSNEYPKDSNGALTSLPLQFQFTSPKFNDFLQHPHQPFNCDYSGSVPMTITSGHESQDSVPIHHAEGENNLNIGGSDCNSGTCETPTLQQTSVSDYTLMSQPFDDYKSSCLFVPPAENYVFNAQVRLNPSGEVEQEKDQMTHNFPVARRDQNTGPDMTTLPAKENNLDNHNYDTDDDLGEPDPQASLLTLVNPKDLPVPDAEYVSRMVSEELHPYIAKKCKKDCRMWLWKSDAQRDAVVAKQRMEMEKKADGKP